MQRDAIAGAEGSYKFRIPIRLRPPQLMVEVRRFQLNGELLLQKIQPEQKGNRIRPSGNGHNNSVTGTDHGILPQKISKLIQHASTPGP